MTEQNKHSYFKRIAGKRVERILEDLDALGNCSSSATYEYNSQELPPIFAAILEKLVETRQRLITHSPYNDVMALLDTGAPAFASLEPVRERYEAEFGNELCWTFPVFHNGNSGCVLLPVQEGILYLPYTEVSSETYEQFDLQDMGLLTKGQAQALLEQIRNVYSQLFCLLSDMQAFGLAQGGEGDHG